jgi:hypothetical protein
MVEIAYALSLKQPWATLLVHGLKTVEVRSWPTRQRGRVLIHAARLPDPRPEAWARLPPELLPAAQLAGGIVGVGEVLDCRPYRSLAAFTVDRDRHLNEPAWFRPPRLYGFVFANLAVLPFAPWPGQTRFFLAEVPTDP